MMTTETDVRNATIDNVAKSLVLKPLQQNSQLRDIVLGPGRHVIGSGEHCNVVLSNPGVSERHCELVNEDGKFSVQPIDRHTWINDGLIRRPALRIGDRLTIGPVGFHVESGEIEIHASNDEIQPIADVDNIKKDLKRTEQQLAQEENRLAALREERAACANVVEEHIIRSETTEETVAASNKLAQLQSEISDVTSNVDQLQKEVEASGQNEVETGNQAASDEETMTPEAVRVKFDETTTSETHTPAARQIIDEIEIDSEPLPVIRPEPVADSHEDLMQARLERMEQQALRLEQVCERVLTETPVAKSVDDENVHGVDAIYDEKNDENQQAELFAARQKELDELEQSLRQQLSEVSQSREAIETDQACVKTQRSELEQQLQELHARQRELEDEQCAIEAAREKLAREEEQLSEARDNIEEDRRHAEEERRKAEEQRCQIEEERRQAEGERRKVDAERQRIADEKATLNAEKEQLAQLKDDLEQQRTALETARAEAARIDAEAKIMADKAEREAQVTKTEEPALPSIAQAIISELSQEKTPDDSTLTNDSASSESLSATGQIAEEQIVVEQSVVEEPVIEESGVEESVAELQSDDELDALGDSLKELFTPTSNAAPESTIVNTPTETATTAGDDEASKTTELDEGEVSELRSQLADMFGMPQKPTREPSEKPTSFAAETIADNNIPADDQYAYIREDEQFATSDTEPAATDDQVENSESQSPSPLELFSQRFIKNEATEDKATQEPSIPAVAETRYVDTPEPVVSEAMPASTSIEQTPATEPASEDDSVADYMKQLLARSKGYQQPEQEQPQTDRKRRQAYARPTAVAEQAEDRSNAAASSPTDNTAETVDTPAKPKRPKPSVDKDAVRRNMDSMREVANLSARTAVANYSSKKFRVKIIVNCALTVLSFTFAFGLAVATIFTNHSYTTYAILSALVGLLTGFELLRSTVIIKRSEKRKATDTASELAGVVAFDSNAESDDNPVEDGDAEKSPAE